MTANDVSQPVPSIGVAGIVFNQQGQVLLIKRGKPPAQGFWSIPGGKLEPGETLAVACRREIKEETGLDTTVKHVVAVVERQAEGYHYIIVDFLAVLLDLAASEPVAQSDVSAARWVGVSELSGYCLVEGLADIIYRSFQTQGQAAGLQDVAGLASDYVLPLG